MVDALQPADAEPTSTLAGPVAWGGCITQHFGHQIANFSTRLLPTLAEMPDVRFAFTSHANHPIRAMDQKMPTFFREILDWYGIAAERVDLISEPTLVERLVVAPQAEQTPRPGPEPWYLDLLDSNTTSRLGEIERSGSLYLSRASQRSRFAGEAYIEGVMEEAGFRVLRPETVSVEEKLRAYAGAESIVLAEGSAVHSAQLLGRALGDVTVLTRRTGMMLAQSALRPRARSLRYVDAVRSLVHGLDMGGNPALYRGLSVLDPNVCRRRCRSPTCGTGRHSKRRSRRTREWLQTEQASERWDVSGTPELVTKNLRAAGLAHQAAGLSE